MSWEPFGPTRLAELAGEAAPVRLPREPARRLIVITCMDARLEPLAMLGLRVGDAHVIRNAGAEVTNDVLRSVRLSHSVMRTERAIVVATPTVPRMLLTARPRPRCARPCRR